MEIIIAIIVVLLAIKGIASLEKDDLDERIKISSDASVSTLRLIAGMAKEKRNRALYFMSLHEIEEAEHDSEWISWSRYKEDRGELSDSDFQEVCNGFLMEKKIEQTRNGFLYNGMKVDLHNQGMRIFWEISNSDSTTHRHDIDNYGYSIHNILNKLYPASKKWYRRKKIIKPLTEKEIYALKVFGQYRFQKGIKLLSSHCEKYEVEEMLNDLLKKIELSLDF